MKLKALFVGACMCMGALSFGQHMPPTDSTGTDWDTENNDVQLFAPNAFTPDGDYYNDTWKVFIDGIDIYDFHLTIFNRSGEIVWESFNTAGEWDGYYGGHRVSDGIYVWMIETRSEATDERHKFTGFISVLR